MRFFPPLIAAWALVLFSCPLSSQSHDLAEKSHRAKQLMAAGKFEEAIPVYRELVRAVPGNAGLITDLGLALDMAGHKRLALGEFERALKIDPQQAPALLFLGTAYVELGQPAKAIAPLERLLKTHPDDFDGRETLAEALLSLNRLDEAAQQFENVSKSNPESPKVWYGLGLCYDRLAQQAFDELAKVGPGSAYWLYLVAESRLETKQNYSAFYFYRQALAKMPSLGGAHAAIAKIYNETGHPDWASVEEKKEQDLPPPDCSTQKLACAFQATDLLGIVHSTEGATGPEAFYWRTRAFNQLALAAYVRLGQLPASIETYELKAKIESQRRQYSEAAKDWRAALNLSPGDRSIEKELAVSLYQTGNLQDARNLFQQLLEEDPNSPDLNYFLGDTELSSQKPGEAIPLLEKAVKSNPQLLPAQRSLGLAYLQTGHADKAIPHLKQALAIDSDGSIHYQLGRAYQMSGASAQASAMFKKYREMQSAEQAENKQVEKDVAITPPD